MQNAVFYWYLSLIRGFNGGLGLKFYLCWFEIMRVRLHDQVKGGCRLAKLRSTSVKDR